MGLNDFLWLGSTLFEYWDITTVQIDKKVLYTIVFLYIENPYKVTPKSRIIEIGKEVQLV